MTFLAALQSAAEALPDDAPATAAQLAADTAPAALDGNDMLALHSPGPARDLLGILAPATEVALPLRARGRTVGLLTLFFA